jgi:hypothetical protein
MLVRPDFTDCGGGNAGYSFEILGHLCTLKSGFTSPVTVLARTYPNPVKKTERTTHTKRFRIPNAHEHVLKLYLERGAFDSHRTQRYDMLSKGPDSITRPRG